MDEVQLERNEEWTDDGVRFVLDQPTADRERRTGVWLFGLIGIALLAVPVAFLMLFVPAFAPLLGPSMIFVALAFGWAVLPPFVAGWMNRPMHVSVERGELTIDDRVFERGTLRSVSFDGDHVVIEPHEGAIVRLGPVEPADPDRVMQLLDCVEVSDDVAEDERAAKREALRRLQPLKQRAST